MNPELYSLQAGQTEIAFLDWDTKNDDANNDTSIQTDIFIDVKTDQNVSFYTYSFP